MYLHFYPVILQLSDPTKKNSRCIISFEITMPTPQTTKIPNIIPFKPLNHIFHHQIDFIPFSYRIIIFLYYFHADRASPGSVLSTIVPIRKQHQSCWNKTMLFYKFHTRANPRSIWQQQSISKKQ